MLFSASVAAVQQVFSPALRAILWRSLLLTLGLLVLIWMALTQLVRWLVQEHPWSETYPFLDPFAVLLAGAGLFVALAYFLPAISIIVAGYFIDDAAEIVERTDFPHEEPGREMSLGWSLLFGLRFALLALAVNLVALAFFFIPIVNVIVFFGANSYLFGREYFELAAMRFRSSAEAAALRKRHHLTVWSAGMVIAGVMLIPLANLLTPLFAIALMVHVHKRIAADRRSSIEAQFVDIRNP
jgi:CysZ protein